MNTWLANSYIYHIVQTLFEAFESSYIKKALSTVARWYHYSTVSRKLSEFIERKPAVQYSRSYKVLSTLGKEADECVGMMHRKFSNYAGSSALCQFFNSIAVEFKERLYLLLIAILVPFIVGYSIIITWRGEWNVGKIVNMLIVFILCLVLFAVKDRWKLWLKESVLFKLYYYIFE